MLARGLSNTTVVQLHRIIREALSHGVKWGVLARNVADATSPPKVQRRSLDMWDVGTMRQFMKGAKESRFGDLYPLAILTGLRRSELCGLKWEHIDLSRGALSVVSTLQRITGYGLVESQPKTRVSRPVHCPISPGGVVATGHP